MKMTLDVQPRDGNAPELSRFVGQRNARESLNDETSLGYTSQFKSGLHSVGNARTQEANMSNRITDNLDTFRLSVLNLGGDRYPSLVKRWCNVLMAMWLLSPHAVLFNSPPRVYDYAIDRFGTHANDHAMGVFMLILGAVSWALSVFPDSVQTRGHWWTACISGVVWANIMLYLWTKWIGRGGEFIPLHFLGFVPLFTSFFVPLRLSSARRKETPLEDFASHTVA